MQNQAAGAHAERSDSESPGRLRFRRPRERHPDSGGANSLFWGRESRKKGLIVNAAPKGVSNARYTLSLATAHGGHVHCRGPTISPARRRPRPRIRLGDHVCRPGDCSER